MSATAEFEIVSDDPEIQAFYEERRREGVGHMLADMLAHQRAPKANDDTTWLAGMHVGETAGIPAAVRKKYEEEWAKQGISVGGGVYVPPLAAYPGDPKAIVRGKGDIAKLAEERGFGLEDSHGRTITKVDNSRTPMEEPVDKHGVAPDIVMREALAKIEDNPELKMSPELLEQTRDEIKPSWAK